MEFIKRDGGITTIDSINDGLIIFIKAFKYFFNQILLVKRLTKSSKFIGPSFNRLRTFGDVFKMVFELLDMATRWVSIGVGQYLPSFIRSF